MNQRYIAALRQASDFQRCCDVGVGHVGLQSRRKESLRIGWITGDLSPHPVSRFLLGFFNALDEENAQHQHHLINVIDHGPRSCIDWFQPIKSLQLTDISAHSIQRKVAAVKAGS